ncbi:hypothetical protein DC3_23070 [Deinococcus cellulosilyticus NBRC 106333 = KACC 11606]|uniref:Peptidase C39-like domain-containing protein n=2 Tax=Deinococcus cellulosilyticus TaxID=401558 RepID=A0A511N1C8_DEIC1|nr:hypothetical protein DC3_23070 [Deinococcus cellulosilyticus NBRC 106333 = KACC 11606]
MREHLVGLLLGGVAVAQQQVELTGVPHEYQRLNNCGPTTTGMYLGYYGSALRQHQVAEALKPNPRDKNVTPQQVLEYVQQQGFQAKLGSGGNLGTLKNLVKRGIPVMVHTWMELPGEGGLGHFRLVTGYDETRRQFTTFDSYLGPRRVFSYGQFDQDWQVMNRTYLVVYPGQKAPWVEKTLGVRMDDRWVERNALRVALREAKEQPDNPFAFFNLGSSLLKVNSPRAAVRAFDRAFSLGVPPRMLWYQFTPFQAHLQAGQPGRVVELTSRVLRAAPDHEEAYFWRAEARLQQGKVTEARADLRQALRFRPLFQEARERLLALNVKSKRP